MHSVSKKPTLNNALERSTVNRKIGTEPIYPYQEAISLDVMNNLLADTANKRPPVVVGQPQSGKTGAMIAVIDRFISWCIEQQKTFQIVVLSALADIDLMKQTEERLTLGMSSDGKTQVGAKLHSKAVSSDLARYPAPYMKEGILVFNNSSRLRTRDLTNVSVNERLVLVDECHVGNIKDGCLDEFFRRHGIEISQQIHCWDNSRTRNHLVVFSATPFAQLVAAEQFRLEGESLFSYVYHSPPANYNSLEKMLKNGRLRQVEPIVVGGSPTEFFTKVKREFKAACREHGPGYLVIRAIGAQHDALMALINNEGGTTECKEVDVKKDNLDQLNATLSKQPKLPTFLVIRGSMRAGITLGDNYIRSWIETGSEGRDVQTQAGAGRACGYGREKDTYPIYVNVAAIREVIAMYNDLDNGRLDAIPAGIKNKAAGVREGQDSFFTRNSYRIKEILDRDKAHAFVQGHRIDPKTGKRNKDQKQISTLSQNATIPLGEFLLHKPGLVKRDSGSTIGYYVDGPPTRDLIEKSFNKKKVTSRTKKKYPTIEARDELFQQHQSAWELIKDKHPEWIGKCIMLDVDNPVNDADIKERNNFHRSRSALLK